MIQNTTRRRLLRNLAVGGVAVAGSALVVGQAAGQPPYTHYTYAQVDTGDSKRAGTADGDGEGTEYLRVAWYATYNGEPLGDPAVNATEALSTPRFVADAPEGPVVQLDGLLPGDSGSLVVGLLAERDPTTVWFRPELLADEEGSLIEPEVAAGDTTAAGELGATLRAELWLDAGVLDSGIAGCNGRRDPGESLLAAPDGSPAEGTAAGLAAAFADGVRLPLRSGNGDCPDALGRGRSACVGLAWSLPPGANDTQTDRLALSLRFVPTACGDEANPFAGDGGLQ
jgi:hypothetical protein